MNEIQWRELFDQAPEGVIVWAEDGEILQVNEAGAAIIGDARHRIDGRSIFDLSAPEDLERLGAERERLRAEKLIHTTWGLLRTDGTRTPVEASIRMLSDGRRLGFFRDVSDKVRHEEALAASEVKYRQIVSIATEAIVSIDEDDRITLYNTGAERMFGWTPDEAIGQSLELLLPPRFREIHHQHLRNFAASGVSARPMAAREPVSALRKSGEEFAVQASISQYVEAGRRYFTAVLRDVSQSVRVLEGERFLATVGSVLAGSLEVEVTLTELGQLAVRHLADFCILDLVEDGVVRRFRVLSRDPARASLADALYEMPLDRRRPHLAGETLQTLQPRLLTDVTPEVLAARSQSPEHLRLLRDVGPRSILSVPMVTRGRLLGAIVLLASDRRYDRHDQYLATELAGRAATALDNSRLHAALHRANQDLQAHVRELEEARTQIRTLEGLLPVCAWCGRIRDEEHEGEWKSLEQFVAEHSEAEFSHGICGECMANQFRT